MYFVDYYGHLGILCFGRVCEPQGYFASGIVTNASLQTLEINFKYTRLSIYFITSNVECQGYFFSFGREQGGVYRIVLREERVRRDDLIIL